MVETTLALPFCVKKYSSRCDFALLFSQKVVKRIDFKEKSINSKYLAKYYIITLLAAKV